LNKHVQEEGGGKVEKKKEMHVSPSHIPANVAKSVQWGFPSMLDGQDLLCGMYLHSLTLILHVVP
jgi:hypothetical protein